MVSLENLVKCDIDKSMDGDNHGRSENDAHFKIVDKSGKEPYEDRELIRKVEEEWEEIEKEDWEVFSPLWVIEMIYPGAHDDRDFLKALHREASRWLTLLHQMKYRHIPYTPAIREKLMKELGIYLPKRRGRPPGPFWDVKVYTLVISTLEDRAKLYTALSPDFIKRNEDFERKEKELLRKVKEEIKTKGVRRVAIKYLKGKGWLHGYSIGDHPTPLDWVLSHPKHKGVPKLIVFYALEGERERLDEAWRREYEVAKEIVRSAYPKRKLERVAREVLLYVLDRMVKKPHAFLRTLKDHTEYLIYS